MFTYGSYDFMKSGFREDFSDVLGLARREYRFSLVEIGQCDPLIKNASIKYMGVYGV